MNIVELSLTWSYQKGYAHAVIYKFIARVLRQAQSLLSDLVYPRNPRRGDLEPQRRPTTVALAGASP